MKQDVLKVTILDDGTLKIETDAVSPANHTNAEGLLKALATLTGGDVERKRRGTAHTHVHTHNNQTHSH